MMKQTKEEIVKTATMSRDNKREVIIDYLDHVYQGCISEVYCSDLRFSTGSMFSIEYIKSIKIIETLEDKIEIIKTAIKEKKTVKYDFTNSGFTFKPYLLTYDRMGYAIFQTQRAGCLRLDNMSNISIVEDKITLKGGDIVQNKQSKKFYRAELNRIPTGLIGLLDGEVISKIEYKDNVFWISNENWEVTEIIITKK